MFAFQIIFEEFNQFSGASEMVTGSPYLMDHSPQVIYGESTSLSRSIQIANDKMVKYVEAALQYFSPVVIQDYEGTCWKISNISLRLENLRSHCFYSSINGYCLSLVLIFGKKEDELLVLLHQSENDAHLTFPFHGRATIGIPSFDYTDGIYLKSIDCNADQCFSKYGSNVAASITIPKLKHNGFIYEDGVYINCNVQVASA